MPFRFGEWSMRLTRGPERQARSQTPDESLVQQPEPPGSRALLSLILERFPRRSVEGQLRPIVGELPEASVFGKQVFGQTEYELARKRIVGPRHDPQPERRQPGG